MSEELLDSGNRFIDDNHESLLEGINELDSYLQDSWNKDEFNSLVENFIVKLENHFSHEEVILKAAKYKDIDLHSKRHRELSMHLRKGNLGINNYDDSVRFLVDLRDKLFSHELFEDQNYWSLFDKKKSEKEELIEWTVELETGEQETDKHHKALVNHINRLHKKFSESSNHDLACRELNNLYEYSKFHFREEEFLLGKKLRPGHKRNHVNLLLDLKILIKEVRVGHYKLENIGGYLKYWLINHIQTFDIPSFKS